MATTMAEAFEKAGVKVPPDVFRPTGEVQPYIQLPLDDEVRVYLPDRTPVPCHRFILGAFLGGFSPSI